MRSVILILAVLFSFHLVGQVSPFSDKSIQLDSSGSYDFTVSGHFYGNSSNNTGYPVNTILGNIENFNSSESEFMICLGDLFLDVTRDIPYYERSFFSQLQILVC